MVPKEIKDNAHAKYREVNKVHYDLIENGEFEKSFNLQRTSHDLQWVVNIRSI